jgi:transposase
MAQYYEEEFKKKIVRLHLEEGRTLKSLSEEYGVSKAGISIWVKAYREECITNHELNEDYDYMKENLRLRKELEDLRKENQFLKKAAAFFAKEID